VNTLLAHVEQSIRTRALFGRGQRVLVAVSGGVDSMVLLHVLHTLASRHGWRLTIAHLNHRLRGRSSDADERLVRQTAKRLDLPFVKGVADVRRLARTLGLSLEMAARKARHDFLARAARRLRSRTIAVAHHADDQVELFFLRLFRGSGGEGLAGMKWRNASPSDSRVELVRPLLDRFKTDLVEYAVKAELPFRKDASNENADIQRNRIRGRLLPLLRRDYQPALDRIVLRLMDIAGAEAECIRRTASDWLATKQRAPFKSLPVAVQRRCIQLQLLQRKLAPDYDLLERLRTAPGTAVTVSPTLAVILKSSGEVHLNPLKPAVTVLAPRTVELKAAAGEIHFGRLNFHWRIDSQRSPVPRAAVAGREVFDADKVGSRLLLRHWQPGDRFQPIGMAKPVKLQDLFTNGKIPREQRHGLVVVATPAGELVWVEKLRISERFKLSRRTNRRLHWRWKPF
jgi:tRNA(Ile)-lysidine synthase